MMVHFFHVRVFSIDEFKKYGAKIILELSATVQGTDRLIPIGTLHNLTSALIINVSQIYENVVRELKQQ